MDKDIIVPVYSATSRYAASFFGSMSIRPSRLPQDYNEANPTISQSLERFISRSSQTTTLEAVISVLKWTQLPGPVFLLGDREYVGSGSQFVVYKQSIAWPEFTGMSYRAVATKQPKISLDPDNALNLAHPEVRGHLQNVLLEILALRNPRLRAHPNIANLEAWSFEPHAFHSSIYLVMELADYNLASYLEDKEMELLLSSKYWICYDIAAGLDTLHGCKLIHGDLKPGNILLYRERGRLVAKLADFGMSVDGLASRETGARLGGTFGWQAPEVEASKMLTWDELPLADNYSFGLVIWSVLLHAGKPPPFSEKESRQAIAKREIEDSRDVIKLKENSCLPQAVFNLLNETKNRPLHLVELVERGADVDETRPPSPFPGDCISRDVEVPAAPQSYRKVFSWEAPFLNIGFVYHLHSRFLQDPRSLSGAMLFAMYLVFTRDPPKVTDSQNAVLDVLVASAVQGYEPAQAVVPMAYEFFESELPLHVSNNLLRWLERAVASGSITARIYLKRLNSTAFSRSIEKFRASGGYNWIYCAIDPSTTHLETFLDSRYSKLHWLATYGTLGDLLGYMDSNKNWKIDSMTENRETSLYLACARGSWEIASVLLRHGARPSIKCTSFKISCLHWLFAFPEEFQLTAAAELIRYGADLDAVAPLEVPFLHYPFVLPPGTPLHWAVATSSPETVRVLVQNGANVLLRNGIDPYVFDDRVRWLNKFDGPDQHGYSISEIATQGLSPLDLAAIQHDPFIFNTLLSLSKQVNINAADEEGFTVLHRLSTKPEGRRRDGGAFSSLPFRGCRAISEENLKSTVATIISLGGDLEQLTTPSAPKAQKAQVNWDGWKLPRYTPLMLALRSPAIDVLKVLLESGASVHTENDLGETVLHCFPQDKISCGESVRLIISHGADVNHRSISGAVPIVKAAQYKLLDVVEALLSAGANIDERECNSIAIEEGANVFALLARATFRDDEDLQVARLLETYVFFCADQEKRRRIVEIGDKEGQTLLHAFAKSSMPCCVDTLLRHGAPANALMKKFAFTLQSKEVGVKSSWYETPMDSLLDIKAFRESQMARYRLWSIQEYGRICQRDNGIIASLKKAGGNSTLKVVVKAEFIYKGPQNEFRRALRDYL